MMDKIQKIIVEVLRQWYLQHAPALTGLRQRFVHLPPEAKANNERAAVKGK